MQLKFLYVLFLLFAFRSGARAQNEKNAILPEPTADLTSFYYPGSQFILDSVSCDLNNDKRKDLILILEKRINNAENAQHQAPLPVVLLKGEAIGYSLIASNNKIVEDLDANCPADGFQKVVAKLNYFTVESTVCYDKYYITQFTTFRFDKATGSILLHKLGLQKLNRQNLEEVIPDEVFTSYDFGVITFQDFEIENLKTMLKGRTPSVRKK